jgi:hypothetical protein
MKGGRLLKNIFLTDGKKLSEKTFVQGLIISGVSILICVVALCSMSYAWFVSDTTSGNNVIESAKFALDIYVTDDQGNSVPVISNSDGTFTCIIENAGLYTVGLEMTADSTASKGYCDIKVNSTEEKQTEPISRDPDIGVSTLSFTVDADVANTVIVFEPKWGISSSADIANGVILQISDITGN